MTEPLRPIKLGFITTPLLICVFFHAINMLMIPFSAEQTEQMILETQVIMERMQSGAEKIEVTPAFVQTVMWVTLILHAVSLLWAYYTRHAVLDGLAWGRVSAFIFAGLSLLGFPIFTILGGCMLYGLMDKNVTQYFKGEYR